MMRKRFLQLIFMTIEISITPPPPQTKTPPPPPGGGGLRINVSRTGTLMLVPIKDVYSKKIVVIRIGACVEK
jgi:hypothetical protein